MANATNTLNLARAIDAGREPAAGEYWTIGPMQEESVRKQRAAEWLSRIASLRISKAEKGAQALRWGQKADFEQSGGVSIQRSKWRNTDSFAGWPERDDDDGDNAGRGFVGNAARAGKSKTPERATGSNSWVETARTTQDVRVENPEDSSQYVIVRRIKTVTFKNALDGRVHTFTLNW